MLLIVALNGLPARGQNISGTKIEFSNTPVLFKENGTLCQKVIGSCKVADPVTLEIAYNGKRLAREDLKRGENRFSLTFPAVKKP